jgi:hypothetical protein
MDKRNESKLPAKDTISKEHKHITLPKKGSPMDTFNNSLKKILSVSKKSIKQE